MSVLEVALFVVLIGAMILIWLPHRAQHWAFRCALIGASVAIAGAALADPRWQIIPACVLAVVVLVKAYWHRRSDFPPAKPTRKHQLAALLGTLSILVLWAAALLPPLVFPDFHPPEPSGPYGVGIVDLHLIDTDRAESMTENAKDHRELMLRVWYPARVPAGAVPEPVLREVEPLHGILARGAPFIEPYMLGHLQRVRSHSYLGAPLAETQERFPVLIFSHGNSFYAGQNALLMEHLASHGYVVFGIDHPYQASVVRFPDGRIVRYRKNWQTKEPLDAAQVEREQWLFYQALHSADFDEYLGRVDQLISASAGPNEGVQLWVQDTAFVLDVLARSRVGGDTLDRITRRVDLNRVGVFGMSLGGAVAGRFCEQDVRCKAGLNMDGLQYGATGTHIRIEKPFMFIYADQRKSAAAGLRHGKTADSAVAFRMNDFAYRRAGDLAYFMTIAGANHMNFSDFGFYSNHLRWVGALGEIEPVTMRDLLNDAVLAFFDHTLRGVREPALSEMLGRRAGVLEFGQRDGRARIVE